MASGRHVAANCRERRSRPLSSARRAGSIACIHLVLLPSHSHRLSRGTSVPAAQYRPVEESSRVAGRKPRQYYVRPYARLLRTTLVAAAAAGALSACDQLGAPSTELGQCLYREHGCASCHGTDGRGDGPVSISLQVRPRDFRDPSAFKKGTAVDSIATTIEMGVEPDALPTTGDGTHRHPSMPRFGHLSKFERQSIAAYVISLRNNRRED